MRKREINNNNNNNNQNKTNNANQLIENKKQSNEPPKVKILIFILGFNVNFLFYKFNIKEAGFFDKIKNVFGCLNRQNEKK